MSHLCKKPIKQRIPSRPKELLMHFECDILNSNLKQTITQCGATQDFAISSDGMAFSFKGHLHTTWTDFDSSPKQAEAVFNKIANSINKNYPGLIGMLQGLQKCIA